MHQLAKLRKSMHLPAMASKLYGYTLHLHLWKQVTCQGLWQDGNPTVIKLGMAQSSIPGGTSCLGTQAGEERKPIGWQRPCVRIYPQVPWCILSSGCGPSAWQAGRMGAQEPLAHAAASSSPVWYSEPATSPRLGQHSKVHCIAFTSSTHTQSSDCVASWGWGEKSNRRIDVNFSVLSFSS